MANTLPRNGLICCGPAQRKFKLARKASANTFSLWCGILAKPILLLDRATEALMVTVTCLGETISGDCLLISHNGVNILIDPVLDLQSSLLYVPQETKHSQEQRKFSLKKDEEYNFLAAYLRQDDPTFFKADDVLKTFGDFSLINTKIKYRSPLFELIEFSEIDVVLLSNSSTLSGLPYITDHPEFNGVIYATEPTIRLGYHYLEELLRNISSSICKADNAHRKLSCFLDYLPEGVEHLNYKPLYDLSSLKKCVSTITCVSFREKVNVYGLLDITPSSSGFSIGSCNWSIQSSFAKICVMTASSTFSTGHPVSIDVEALKNGDLLIMNGLSPFSPTPVADVLGEICRDVALAVSSGGNVLFPVRACGLVYDLLEILHVHLNNLNKQGVPFYLISMSASASLAYSNIFSEWLNTEKAERVFLPEAPFAHEEMTRAQRLIVLDSVANTDEIRKMRQPCVVFTGDPTLRWGDSCYFLRLWKSNPHHLVVFTDPDVSVPASLAPFLPIKMKVRIHPTDTRFTAPEVNALLSDFAFHSVLMPKNYLSGFFFKEKKAISPPKKIELLTYESGDEVHIPLNNRFITASMTKDLANSIRFCRVSSQTLASSINGQLSLYNNTCELVPFMSSYQTGHLFGTIETDKLVQTLINNLHGGVQIIKKDSLTLELHFESLRSVVHVSPHKTIIHVEDGNEATRLRIKALLLQHLTTLNL
ncbi:integrator complex subunit 9-like [Zophobas morio]|uniref:integrator complex subunit 9-like n=1 Tax=Zophobas morio TaxID=2755281 RepID=UPI00308328DD